MAKAMTAKRRERGRKKALIAPLLSAVLGAAIVISSLTTGDQPAVGVWGGGLLLVFNVCLFLFMLRFMSKRNYYKGQKPPLAAGEDVLWNERVTDLHSRFAREGGLTLTSVRLAFMPTPHVSEPPADPREWPLEAVRLVSAEALPAVQYPGDGGTLVPRRRKGPQPDRL